MLASRDIGSLSDALKSFKNLRGMLHGLIDLLFFSLVISQRTSSEFVDFLKEGIIVWVAQIVRIIDFRFF